MVPCIVNSKIDKIIANLGLRLANNNINSEAFEYFLFEIIQILHKNSVTFYISILKSSGGIMEDRRIFWGKIPIDIENNIEYNQQKPYNHINNLKTIIVDRDEVMPLGNDMFQTADKSLFD